MEDVDRWLDVVVAATVVAVVVQILVRHADQLVSRLKRSETQFRALQAQLAEQAMRSTDPDASALISAADRAMLDAKQ